MLGGLAYFKSLYVILTKNWFQMSKCNKGLKSNVQYLLTVMAVFHLGPSISWL